MTHDEFALMIAKASAEATPMDRRTPPTLDEWTVAIETLKTRETGRDWFERVGLNAANQAINSDNADALALNFANALGAQNQAMQYQQYAMQYQQNAMAGQLAYAAYQQQTPYSCYGLFQNNIAWNADPSPCETPSIATSFVSDVCAEAVGDIASDLCSSGFGSSE